MALTEVQRRKHFFDEIESSNPLKQLAEHCLHNRPQSRPHANELVTTIQVLNRGGDHIEEILGTSTTNRLKQENKLVSLKKELDTFKEANKRLEDEIAILREQLYKKKALSQSEEGMILLSVVLTQICL